MGGDFFIPPFLNRYSNFFISEMILNVFWAKTERKIIEGNSRIEGLVA